MGDLNSVFLEEFKRLDKILREMYQGEKGVTNYIHDMKSIPVYESRQIPNWKHDLKRLKELRDIRNQLSHEVGTLNVEMCTQEDIRWLKEFYRRIIRRSDPLALLRREKAAEMKGQKAVPMALEKNKGQNEMERKKAAVKRWENVDAAEGKKKSGKPKRFSVSNIVFITAVCCALGLAFAVVIVNLISF